MKILHVVRRYGPVGGMERYAWEITRELSMLGHQVEVLCERCFAEAPNGIAVHELGKIAKRPRWLSQVRFSRRAAKWLQQHPRPGYVIHSHERVDLHDVTTFHGPPFASVRDKPFWSRISLRVAVRFYLERRELRVARYIVPNSAVIKEQLAHYYPEYAGKLTDPIVPGVAAQPRRHWQPAPADGGVIGFVGQEWPRKGLPLAVEIAARIRRERPNLELWVVGPQPHEVQHLFKDWEGGYRLLGWRQDMEHLGKIDVLLHPASAEPYGMVICEAMAAQVPVVVSDACGAAADVAADAGTVVSLQADAEEWVRAVEGQLRRREAPPVFERSWRKVATEYEALYRQCVTGGASGNT